MGHDDGNDGGGNPPFDPPRRPVNLECSVTDSMEVNCSSTVYGDRQQWRSSRAFVNEQIRRLRAQLMELKVIKKLLLYMQYYRFDLSYIQLSKGNSQAPEE